MASPVPKHADILCAYRFNMAPQRNSIISRARLAAGTRYCRRMKSYIDILIAASGSGELPGKQPFNWLK